MRQHILLMTLSVAVCTGALAQEDTGARDAADPLIFRATLEPLKSTVIVNTVEGRSVIAGIFPDGKTVRAGDVICAIESAGLDQLVDTLQVELAKVRADYARAASELKSQELLVQTEQAVAEAEVRRIKSALEAWTQGEYPLRKAELEGDIRIGTAELEYAKLAADAERQTRLEKLRFEVDVTRAEVRIHLAQLQLKYFQEFESPHRIAELEAEIRLAVMHAEQSPADRNTNQLKSEMAAREQQIAFVGKRLERALEQLNSGRIVAPHDGVVVHASQASRRAEPLVVQVGQEVREGQPLMQVHDLSRIHAVMLLEPDESEQLKIGSRVDVEVDALPGRNLTGKLMEIGKVAATQDGKRKAVVLLDRQDDAPLLPGMTALVTIKTAP